MNRTSGTIMLFCGLIIDTFSDWLMFRVSGLRLAANALHFYFPGAQVQLASDEVNKFPNCHGTIDGE